MIVTGVPQSVGVVYKIRTSYVLCQQTNHQYIILNLGYCRVFAETFSAKTRQYPRFKIM